jgi:ribonuclease HI
MIDEVEVYTDGACSGNPGPGGWAALLMCKGAEKMISGGDAQTTNNKMELQAAIEALKALKRPSNVKIYTDSTYLKDGMMSWIVNWKKRGWKNASGKPVKNKEQWVELDNLVEYHGNVSWAWVKAHAGNVNNERVDSQARLEAEKFL